MTHDIEEEYKAKIIALLSALLPNAKIYLFGSRARKTHKPFSDIDLAVEETQKIPFEKIGELKSIMEATNIPYKIDIVDINAVSPEMRAAIVKDRQSWKS